MFLAVCLCMCMCMCSCVCVCEVYLCWLSLSCGLESFAIDKRQPVTSFVWDFYAWTMPSIQHPRTIHSDSKSAHNTTSASMTCTWDILASSRALTYDAASCNKSASAKERKGWSRSFGLQKPNSRKRKKRMSHKLPGNLPHFFVFLYTWRCLQSSTPSNPCNFCHLKLEQKRYWEARPSHGLLETRHPTPPGWAPGAAFQGGPTVWRWDLSGLQLFFFFRCFFVGVWLFDVFVEFLKCFCGCLCLLSCFW